MSTLLRVSAHLGLGLWAAATAGLAAAGVLPDPVTFSSPTLIEAPDGDGIWAFDVNNPGVVVGVIGALPDSTIDQPRRAFLWSPQKGFIDLNPPGNPRTFSRARAINDCGEIAGDVTLGNFGSRFHAVKWRDRDLEQIEDLESLGGDQSFAGGINERGDVVGSSTLPNNATHAFLWTKSGGMRDLGTLPGGRESAAVAVNNLRHVVGYSSGLSSGQRPFFWSKSKGMIDLTPPGFDFGAATDINDAGVVTGWAQKQLSSGTVGRSFRWTPGGGFAFLGSFGGLSAAPLGINEANIMVGDGSVQRSLRRARPILWLPSKLPVVIDALTGDTASAYQINDRGQIVGVAIFPPTDNAHPVGAVWQIVGYKPRLSDIAAAAEICKARKDLN